MITQDASNPTSVQAEDILVDVPVLLTLDGAPAWMIVPLEGPSYLPGESVSLDGVTALSDVPLQTVIDVLQTADIDAIADAMRKDTTVNIQTHPNPTPEMFWYLAAQAAVERLLYPIIRKSSLAAEG